jgi:capsular polysaccharide export protein
MTGLAPAAGFPVRPPAYALGFSLRKQRLLRKYLDDQPVSFVRRLPDVPDAADLIVWGSMIVPDASRYASLRRVEDGFLRSVGLGAAFARPSSWIIDGRGIYYDGSRPSDLEAMLQAADFDPETLARAARLRKRIVDAQLTKYNLPGAAWRRPAGKRLVCLVVGQVESDAALRLGAPDIHTNLELARRVRAARPDAWLLYKPHPDVRAGLRDPGESEAEIRHCIDEVVADADITSLFAAVDEVHVLTSLAGFEALLRGKRVMTYGQPVYAGWGLSTDHIATPRRSRRLTLDELVAGSLLRYPRYLSTRGGQLTSAESVLDELAARRRGAGAKAALRSLLGTLAGRVVRVVRAAHGGL